MTCIIISELPVDLAIVLMINMTAVYELRGLSPSVGDLHLVSLCPYLSGGGNEELGAELHPNGFHAFEERAAEFKHGALREIKHFGEPLSA